MYFHQQRKWEIFPLIFPYEYIILLIFGLWCFNFVTNLITYNYDQSVFQEGINLLTMFIGYFLLRGIFLKASSKDINDFINFILFVNMIALGIFIADYSMNLGLLPPSYSETLYQNTLIRRSYLPTPMFWLGIAYVLSITKWKLKEIILIVFSLIAILLSGTRSLLLITGILFVTASILQFTQRNDRKYLGQKLLVISILGVLLLGIVTTYFQANLNYFSERFSEITNIASISQNNTLNVRVFDIQQTFTMIQQPNLLTGIGFVGQETGYWLGNLYIWFADSDWSAVLWHYGFLGLGLFCGLYFLSMVESLKYYLISTLEQARYWLMLLLLVLAIVIYSLFSWTTFNLDQYYVLSFFPFALITVGLLKLKYKSNE